VVFANFSMAGLDPAFQLPSLIRATMSERQMRKTLLAALFGLSSTLLSSCAGTQPPLAEWVTRPGGVVQTASGAITVARAVWIAANPSIASRIGSEEVWQRTMTATNENGVWRVYKLPNPEDIGGGMEILISQSDAHLINMQIIY
jgi:hypothetical protein